MASVSSSSSYFPAPGHTGFGGLPSLWLSAVARPLLPATSSAPPRTTRCGARRPLSFGYPWLSGPFFVASGNIFFPLHDNVWGAAAIFLSSAVVWASTLARLRSSMFGPCVETHGARGCSSVLGCPASSTWPGTTRSLYVETRRRGNSLAAVDWPHFFCGHGRQPPPSSLTET